MMNNNGPYGPNEIQKNVIVSHNRSQSDRSYDNHNLDNFNKIVEPAASSGIGSFQAHDMPNFEQRPLNIHQLLPPSQAYQITGYPSSYMPENNPFGIKNTVKNNFIAGSTGAQAEQHHNMLNFHQNALKTPSESQPTLENKSSVKNHAAKPQKKTQCIRRWRSSKSSQWQRRNHETTTESRNRSLIGYNLLVNTEIYHHISTNSFYQNPLLRSMSQNTYNTSENSYYENSPRSMSHNPSVSSENRTRITSSNFTKNDGGNFSKYDADDVTKNDRDSPKNLSQNLSNSPGIMSQMYQNSLGSTENNSEMPSNTFTKNDGDTYKDLSQKLQISAENKPPPKPSVNQEVSLSNIETNFYNSLNHNQNTSSENGITEKKRQSLEKTVRLIESIIIRSTNNNTKTNIITDPLALSPNPITSRIKSDTENLNSVSSEEEILDSDDEFLIKKLARNKRKPVNKSPSKKIQSTRRSHVIETETEVQYDMRMKEHDNVNVKSELLEQAFYHPCDSNYTNPFHRDSNGKQRSNVSDTEVINMETSVGEASNAIKNGTNSSTYFECPHCSLLLLHPKRFLIHTKWHNFGLLNQKRAETAREHEERIKEKREARSMQRLSVTEATGGEQVPCKDCDKVFQNRNSLKNHRRRFHATGKTQCRICLLPFYGLKALRIHMNTHTDAAAGTHQCPYCPKRFKYRHSLAKHADTHLEKTHACPECSKMFGSVQLVKLHMKTHERMARGTTYHCSYCGKGFYETYNLNVHERTHRNDKPFKCDICASCFVTNSSLKRHIKVSHSGAKPHICKICQKCFSTESIRDRHELRVHSDQKQFPHECQLCPRRYMKPKDLRNHMYKMHSKKKKQFVNQKF